jgi:hypothetical protein
MENAPMLDLVRRVRLAGGSGPARLPALAPPATGDTTYGTIDNINGLEGDGIRAFVPLPDFSQPTGYLPLEVFTYDDANDRYICPHSQELRLIETCRCGLYNLDSPKLFYRRAEERGVPMADYPDSAVLVETEWLASNASNLGIRIVEVDEDREAYDAAHIPGAIPWHWQKDLHDPLRRDFIDSAGLQELLTRSGVVNETTVILYGGNNNWFAAYAYWYVKYQGFDNVKLL